MFDAKSVSDKTPEPYQEWLKAINESLDKQVEETDTNSRSKQVLTQSNLLPEFASDFASYS
ncbi:hypothetical protein QUF54_07035 [Candidatus Marithioploca araucensis]|uniref:PH domain-containing protein n=1 Tax=Candidatus Marithioploca araucensis TaxID=70273 RepID=A0ABT7VU25_9GAMM|nr:hypothetical protein [Candidatus Marithioploca araucensis]